jgi:NAD(P)-dependent dehydrogenase (short-subunit alcohol dehydrogenase family)
MPVQYDFSGQVALVTGAAAGIGRASALAFARAGARVALADVDAPGGEETARLIQAAGGEALFVRTDVSQAQEVAALIDRVVHAYGRLDVALNNAGVGPGRAPTHEVEEADFDRTIAVDLKGVWLCMKHEIPVMLEQGRGAIVNMASTAGLVAMPGSVAYNTAKHGVIGLTRTAALEYAAAGIRINALCPGVVRTPLVAPALADPAIGPALVGLHPLGRVGEAEEVAQAVLWLASEGASFTTGAALTADGGWTQH